MNDVSQAKPSDMTTPRADAGRPGLASGWLMMIVLSLFGLLGIYISAHAIDLAFQLFGVCLAGFAVLMLFRVIALLLPAGSAES